MAAAREQLLAMTKNSLELTEPDDVQLLPPGRDAEIELVGIRFAVRHAPGHTEGSAVFQAERGDDVDVLFSGDVLFQGSIGRTDLPGGSPDQMNESLRDVIWPMTDEIVVLPGHGPHTTIGQERASNPFLQAAGSGRDAHAPNRGW